MEKIPSSHSWVKFFQDAGIPDDLSARYAVMFTDHRIQRDMLSELDRGILSDIGIKAVGDKMAILKHAKFISEQSKRDASSKELASGLKKPMRNSTPALSEPPGPSVPVNAQPRKKIKFTTMLPPVDKSPTVDPSFMAPKTGKKSVFQRLGEGSSNAVFDRLGETGKECSETSTMSLKAAISPSILNRLGGEVTELPDSSTAASQKLSMKKVVTLKKKAINNMLSSNDAKRTSVLDRLGHEIHRPAQKTQAKEKQKSALKPSIISLTSPKNKNLIKISPKRKQDVDLGKLVVTAKKPISSNAVSSTSAGLFRGAAESGSSVFDRLGPK